METLSRSCMPSCMKETGALCTELFNMCEVDAVAPSRRPFMGLASSEIVKGCYFGHVNTM